MFRNTLTYRKTFPTVLRDILEWPQNSYRTNLVPRALFPGFGGGAGKGPGISWPICHFDWLIDLGNSCKKMANAIHKDGINNFHKHLNRQNVDLQFTKEIKENGKIPFLDCLVTRDNDKLKTTIYRKPTHTDQLLDQSSYNPTSHKAITIRTLTRRAQLVCVSPDCLQDETDYLNNVF